MPGTFLRILILITTLGGRNKYLPHFRDEKTWFMMCCYYWSMPDYTLFFHLLIFIHLPITLLVIKANHSTQQLEHEQYIHLSPWSSPIPLPSCPILACRILLSLFSGLIIRIILASVYVWLKKLHLCFRFNNLWMFEQYPGVVIWCGHCYPLAAYYPISCSLFIFTSIFHDVPQFICFPTDCHLLSALVITNSIKN